jgi:hypothetical protein
MDDDVDDVRNGAWDEEKTEKSETYVKHERCLHLAAHTNFYLTPPTTHPSIPHDPSCCDE